MFKKSLSLAGAMLLLAYSATGAVAQSAPQSHAAGPQQPSTRTTAPGAGQSAQSYGTWRSSWGERPPAPPSHWKRKGDWYRHVRACQQRYHYYYARTDTYRTRTGAMRRCTL